MKSALAKVLHPVGGRSMVSRAVEVTTALTNTPPVVVVGHDAEAVKAHLADRARYVHQSQLLGTGHAVMQATDTLRGTADLILVTYGDMPILREETLRSLITTQQASQSPFTLLTVRKEDPKGFGRILRNGDGQVIAIVEEAEATPEQKAIRELNVGVYAFRASWLWEHLPSIRPKKKGEYYLTDLLEIAVAQGSRVESILVTDPDEVIGVNNRIDLADAEAALRKRVCRRWQLEGVTVIDPATTYIEDTVKIGMDTVIQPNTHLRGNTVIGVNCQIGPNTVIEDSQIGDQCRITGSVVESAILEAHVDVGPYAHLRTGAYLCEGVHMGNFGEVKNSRLGKGTRMGHFSYVGDADVGEDVNIGAGVVTANYDGKRKHRTQLGDHSFIGSDTILRAPVTVGDSARTGAGSVVTKDVPPHHIAVGVPARNRRIPEDG
jgi:bifunctional UDP-N-acetylglucosamine pyrophosphorylase/glucosamine-1-phosphate N-acetyltransferase